MANSFGVLPLLSALAQELGRRNLPARVRFGVYLLYEFSFITGNFPKLLGNIIGGAVFANQVVVEVWFLLLIDNIALLE